MWGDRADETVINSSKSKNEKFRKSRFMPNIRVIRKLIFLTPNAKKRLTIYG